MRGLATIFKMVLAVVITISCTFCCAQNVGINDDGSLPDASAVLDVKSTTKGMLVPRMTTSEKNAITSPAVGLLVFDITLNTFYFYNGAWVPIPEEPQTISRTGTTVTLSNGGGTFEDSVGVYTAGAGIDITNNVISATSTSPCGLSIGDTYQGGIIFYLDASGCHGLISAPTDQSTGVRWYAGTNGVTRATGDGLYAGEANTAIIIASQVALGDDGSDYAAQICNDLQITVGGVTYGDWYLPSKYELDLMYENIGQGNALGLGNVGGFANTAYWSSTEYLTTNAFYFRFYNGNAFHNIKLNTLSVRAVRAF